MNNKKLKQVFSFIILSLFAISLPITIYILKTGNLDLRINAFESEEPVSVIVTDKSSQGFKVLWITEKKVFGAIRINEIGEIISENFETNSHYLEFDNLEPNKAYTFTIYSGTSEFPQDQVIKTLDYSESGINNYYIFGQVFDKTGIKVQQVGLVTLKATDGNLTSELIGTTLNETGGFQINIDKLIQTSNGKKFNYSKNIDITLTINTGMLDAPVIKNYTFNFINQRQIPNIYLGDINLDIIPGVEGN